MEGEGYDLGYLHGALSARVGDARSMCVTYVHHIIINLLDETWDEEMAAKCEGWVPGVQEKSSDGMSCEAYEMLLTFMEKWLIAGSVHSFHHEKQKFPSELIVEMEAFVEGALSEDADCGCSFDKLIYINYGIDFVMSALYSGELPHVIAREAAKDPRVPSHLVSEFQRLPASAFRGPYFCNSFAVKGAATASGEDVFMSRDFQMPTGLVYQDTAADIIFFPTDGRLPHVSSGAPGFIGRVTVMNSRGVAMGVDMLRAAPCTPDSPGMNSLLLLRHVADRALNTPDAVELVASTERGTTWLYPICDMQGDCVTIEAGRYTAPGEPFNPLQFVNSSELRNALPSEEFYATHSSDDIFDRGMYTRPIDWRFPEEYLEFNKGLYDLAGVPFNDSDDVWGKTGYVFSTFDEENEITKTALHNNFFPPMRENLPDVQLVSNNAIVPEFRTSMMSYAGNFWEITAHAAQWRYDDINARIMESYGSIDAAKAMEIASFLSPRVTPGYWTNTINESDPMSAIIEGTINVMQLSKTKGLKLASKTGYWSDAWTHITLTEYL